MKNGKRQIAWFLSMLMVIMLISPTDATVSSARKKSVKLKKVVLNHKTYKLQKGKKLKLKASFKPKNTTQKKLVWKSSKKSVASVSKKGVVTAKKVGKATITAKVKGTKKKATCKIQVVQGGAANDPGTEGGENVPTAPVTAVPTMPQATLAAQDPSASPSVTPKYERPAQTAPPVQRLDLTGLDAFHVEEIPESNVVINPDGSLTITFTQQYAAIDFYLPDNAQNYYSNYKSVVITYTSEGGDLGHALFDAEAVGAADPSIGKHPDWNNLIVQSANDNTITFSVTPDCQGGCIRGFQIFNPNLLADGQTITITIKSITFSEKENPTEEDLRPIETTTPAPSGTPGTEPTATATVIQTETPDVKPTAVPTAAPTGKPTLAPTAKPTTGPIVPSPTATPVDPYGTAAPPVKQIDLTAEGAFHNESSDGATVVKNPDGSLTVTFTRQWAALNFYLPDTVQNSNSAYKSVVLTYTSEGGNLGHSLYDIEMVGASDRDKGKHPDWDIKVVESQAENKLIFPVTTECKGDCIRGFQIFNPNELKNGKTITITIKSIIFSDKENPSEEDLRPGATAAPTAAPTASPTAEPTATPTLAPTATPYPIMTREPGPYGISGPEAITDVTWDCINFGSYYQSLYQPKQLPANPVDGGIYTDSDDTVMIYRAGSYYKKEPIKWRVLSINGDNALIIADQNLDTQAYITENSESASWESSDIREWLNGEFLQNAFTDEERGAILETDVSTEDNSEYGTAGGADTKDMIFLLSAEEAKTKEYGFAIHPTNSSKTRQAKNTAYAEAQGAWANDSADYEDNGWWWLRSPGSFSFDAMYIGSEGIEDYAGFLAVNTGGGVRPVLHLNLNAASWSTAGQVTTQSADDLRPTPEPTENPVKKVELSSGRFTPSECAKYDIDTDTITVNDTRTGYGDTTFAYFPIPVTVAPGEKLRVTVSGSSWGTKDFRIWTTPKWGEESSDYVENHEIFLKPETQSDGSFSGTVELTAKEKNCDRITLKPAWNDKIQNLVITSITVERIGKEGT